MPCLSATFEAAVLGVRRARIAGPVAGELLRVNSLENFVSVGIDENGANAELGRRRRRQPRLLGRVFTSCDRLARCPHGMPLFGSQDESETRSGQSKCAVTARRKCKRTT